MVLNATDNIFEVLELLIAIGPEYLNYRLVQNM